MAFNGIGGYLNSPGMIPWEIVVIYFIVATVFAIAYGWSRGAGPKYKTVDLVYIGVGAAFTTVWEFFVGPFLDKFVPAGAAAYIGFGFFGRILIVLIVAGLVRKVGSGMLTLLIFNLLGDIFHYGFSGEPIYTIYETLTYGLFIDLMIAVTHGHLFGIGADEEIGATSGKAAKGNQLTNFLSKYTKAAPVIMGGVIGFLWAIPDNVLYAGFFNPFLYGGIVNWQSIIFSFWASVPGNIVFGIIAALIAVRVSKVLGQ